MSREVLLFLAVFLACAVEGVEAVTIVLAAGLTRGWRSALTGVGVALVVLAAVVAALGPALTALPIDVLRLVVGVWHCGLVGHPGGRSWRVGLLDPSGVPRVSQASQLVMSQGLSVTA